MLKNLTLVILTSCSVEPSVQSPTVKQAPTVGDTLRQPVAQTCHVDVAEFQSGLEYSSCTAHVVSTVSCDDGPTAITVDVTDAGDQFLGLAMRCNETVEFDFAVRCGPLTAAVWFDNSNNQDVCGASTEQLQPCPALEPAAFARYSPGDYYLWSTYGTGTRCIEVGL